MEDELGVKTYDENELNRDIACLDAAWENEEKKYVHYRKDGSDDEGDESCSRIKVEPEKSRCIAIGIASITFFLVWIVVAIWSSAPNYILIVGCVFLATIVLKFILEYKIAVEYQAKLRQYQQVRNGLISHFFSAKNR